MVPGSHTSKQLAGSHADHSNSFNQAAQAQGKGRALELDLEAWQEAAVHVPVKRGDVTIHDEWIVHGSGGNALDVPRKTYVMAFRDAAMVAYEREIGFHHSYTDGEVLTLIRTGKV